ncbi:serine hydrolase domain-containing protein [Sphingobium sp. SCG-1]|uniref:serine hydrolase domain-containing protein n=1 Tax=Sphingobium sp. SCG-1 TaxID=2072936 RepID=UPI001CB992A7|nr:serine hydrolase domain-containing protein [Sphingobium sp. SCG-1]
MPYALRAADVPGAVVVIVKDGHILSARGFGYADPEADLAVNPEKTLFRVGSISKLFTWTAVMQLVEQGKLDLDQDVNAYIDFQIPDFKGRPLTLRKIMTHTTGFDDVLKGIVFYDPRFHLSLSDYVKKRLPRRVDAPGSTPAYSNYAVALAGYIVQRRSGENFDTYIERHIFAPLGMTNSTFSQPLPAAFRARLATGYAAPGRPSPSPEFLGPEPAGGATTSAMDMARFMIAHLQDGQFDGKTILNPVTAQRMHDSARPLVERAALIPPLNKMELGFFETNINDHRVIGHLGDTQAFHSALHLFLRERVGLFIAMSSPGRKGAANGLRTSLFQDFADRYFPSNKTATVVDPRLAHASALAGIWWPSRRPHSSFLSLAYLAAQVRVASLPDGTLSIPGLTGPNERPRRWVEIAPYVWRDRDGHDRLAAQVSNGRATRWSYDFLSPVQVYDRVPPAKSSAWIFPVLGTALFILLISFFRWPLAWAVRRHFSAPVPFTAEGLRTYRALNLLAGLNVLLFASWSAVIAAMFQSLDTLAGRFDWLVFTLQGAGIVIFFGTVLLAAWNVKVAWTDRRRWTSKTWGVVLLMATAATLYVAVAFDLMAMTTQY